MTHALSRWPNEQHRVASVGGAPLSQNLLEEAVLHWCSAQKRQLFHYPDPDSGLTHSAGSSIIKAQKPQNPSFIFSPWRLFCFKTTASTDTMSRHIHLRYMLAPLWYLPFPCVLVLQSQKNPKCLVLGIRFSTVISHHLTFDPPSTQLLYFTLSPQGPAVCG